MNDSTDDRLYKIRHTLAHVMAQAVCEMHPHARLGIGPPTADGFYYDFELGNDQEGNPVSITAEDLPKIEKRMRQICGGNFPLEYQEVTADEAREMFADQPFKLELVDGLEAGQLDESGEESEVPEVISIYRQDTFVDLCRGPHVHTTGEIPKDAFKLLTTAGAYWRGDEKRPMLQRIYGTAWLNKKALNVHLKMLEEAKKRDHRKIGKELQIFFFDEEVGPGLPLWTPRGTVLVEELERLAHEIEREAGYQPVRTPHVTKENLFLKSGHLPYYAESMFPPMECEGISYYVKPMNCPFHHKIFGSQPRSYRDLPLRLSEYGTCYRYEKSGQLFGLMRVRSMQMNDAHIYCTDDQFEQEFLAVVEMYMKYFELFGIEKYRMRLSTHAKKQLGKKYVDNERLWLHTEDMVRRALVSHDIPHIEVADEAAFYGPKIDVQIYSAIGREFTLATNQVDFAVPERFNLSYASPDGDKTPLCIHRAPLGTHERMIGFLIEHYAGKFPVWLSPVQVLVVPITEDHHEYARTVEQQLFAMGIRVEADCNSDRMNAKIRKGQKMQIPYMLVVGDSEVESQTVAVRLRNGERRSDVPLAKFVADIAETARTRSPEL